MWFLLFSMFMDTPEDEKTKLISCLAAFRQFWNGLSQVRHFFSNIRLMTFGSFFCFLRLHWSFSWGGLGKGKIKLPSFYIHIFTGEPALKVPCNKITAGDVFLKKISPMLDYIRLFYPILISLVSMWKRIMLNISCKRKMSLFKNLPSIYECILIKTL